MTQQTSRQGYLYERDLDDEKRVFVIRMLFTFRVAIGTDQWIDDGWCYNDPAIAIAAAVAWDGDGDPPDGWHRQISTGRRRPDGEPGREYVEH